MGVPLKTKKTKNFIILGFALLVIGWWLIYYTCSTENFEFCKRDCETDEDCKYECGCGCISKNVLCISNAVCRRHVCSECYCENGKCRSWVYVFNEALKKKNASICAKIKSLNCRNLCYEYLEGNKKGYE